MSQLPACVQLPREDHVGVQSLQRNSFDIIPLAIWVWVKTKAPGDRRFQSLVPFTRLPKRIPIFDPQPYEEIRRTCCRTPEGTVVLEVRPEEVELF